MHVRVPLCVQSTPRCIRLHALSLLCPSRVRLRRPFLIHIPAIQLPVASAYRLATRMNQALEQYWRPPQGRHRDALLARSPDPRDFWVGRQRSVHAYHELLQIQGAHGHVDAAVITLDEVVAAGMMPTPNMLSTMVHVYASHGRLHEAEAMLGDMRNRTARERVAVLRVHACARALCPVCLPPVCAGRVPLSAAPYTSLAHAYGVRGQLNSAFALRERMHADGVAPDAAFFTTLMHSVLRAGQYARVFRVFEDMCDEGVEADQVTFNVMLLACGRMRNAERAFSLWSNMRIHNLTPTDFNFEAVLYALSTSPHMYDRVFEVYEQYVGEGFKPTTYAYDMLLLATARAGRVKDSQVRMRRSSRR